jgi:hypothetical protein
MYTDIDIFWVMTPCSLVGVYRYFGETRCLHLQYALLFSIIFTLLIEHWRAFLVATCYMFHFSRFDISNISHKQWAG